MKRIFFLLLLANAALGQTPTQTFNGLLYRYNNGLQVNGSLFTPRDTTTWSGSVGDSGRLAYKNGRFYGRDTVSFKAFKTGTDDTYNVIDFGAKGDGITNDSAAFARAINSGSKKVFIPKGRYLIQRVDLRGDLEIFGESGTVVVQQTNSLGQVGAFEYRRTDGSTDGNIYIHDIEFESQSSNNLNNAILFLVDTLSRVENVKIDRVKLTKQRGTGILFLNRFQDYLGIRNVSITNCSLIGDPTQPTQSQAANLVRFFGNHQIFLPRNYGKVYYEGVSVTNCYAEYGRTLADMKRGGRNVIVYGNKAYNMYDIPFSIDGCYSGSIVSNTIDADSTFFLTYGSSSIEVQGENILVGSNQIRRSKVHGILITDYGYPDEGGVGHNSRNITITGNSISRAGDMGIKTINVIGGLISDNYINFAKTRSISIDNGTGRVDTLGALLKSKFVSIFSNRISDTSNLFVASDSSVIGRNYSSRQPAVLTNSGLDNYTEPTTATDYLNLIKTVDGSGSGLDADLFDGRESNTFYGNSFTAFTDFNSATGNNIYDLSGFQPSNRPATGNFFSVLNIDNSVANNNRFQMAWQLGTQNIHIRNQTTGSWSSWNRLYHTGDFSISTSATASTVPVRDASGGIFSTSVSTAITTTSSNITLDATHGTLIATSPITVNLPTASTASGRIYYIVNYNTGGNITFGTAVLKGGASVTTMTNNAAWRLQSNGTSWYVTGE